MDAEPGDENGMHGRDYYIDFASLFKAYEMPLGNGTEKLNAHSDLAVCLLIGANWLAKSHLGLARPHVMEQTTKLGLRNENK